MVKQQPPRRGWERSPQTLAPIRPASPLKSGKWSAVVAGVGLVIYVAVAYLALPNELPALLQWSFGLGCAALAALVFALATRPTESAEELLHRMRRGQHADFGKRLRKVQPKRHAINLPILGETSHRALGGLAVFLVVFGWWLSPLAPVGVKKQAVEDLSVPLGNEIAAVVLIMPDAQTATLQPPIVPPRARELAKRIGDGSDSYQRGRKALAEGRFNEARSLLAAATANVDAQPHEILVAQAQNEMYAGQFSEAAEWYEKAVGQKPDDPMLLSQMAVAWMQAGKFDKAEPLVSRAVEICREKLLEKDPALAYCLHVKAVLSIGLGRRYDEAGSMCFRGRGICKDALGRQHPFVAASLNNQATLYLLQAKYPGAEQLYEGARETWADTLEPRHPHVGTSLANLAMLRYNLGRYAEAKELLQQALAIRREGLPATHPILALSRNANALVDLALSQTRRQHEQAQRLAEKALEDSEKVLGREHPHSAAILHNLATCYAQQARYSKAQRHYLRALAITERFWGPSHPYLAGILNDQARLYIAQGRCGKAEAYQKAEEACGQALVIFQDSFGENHPGAAATLNLRGRLEIERGQLREARPYLEKALAIREQAFGKEHPDVARTLGNLAALDGSPQEYSKGVAGYKRAIQMAEKLLGAEHPDVARLWYGLAALHAGAGKQSEAERCLSDALEIQEKALVAFHPDLAATLEAYASLLRETDPDRAAQMQSRAKSIRSKHAREDQSG